MTNLVHGFQVMVILLSMCVYKLSLSMPKSSLLSLVVILKIYEGVIAQ